jgi:hypothetical protein
MESLNGSSLKGWHTKQKPNCKKIYQLLFIIHEESIMNSTVKILPGFAQKNGMIEDWQRKLTMPCFQKFSIDMITLKIIAWKPFPKLPKELKKMIYQRPFYLKRKTTS